jgi:hypothetical protein
MTSAGTSSYQERNYLAHLVRACHSRSKVVFVLAAYLDDSGSEGDQPIIAAAGYVAKRTQLPELEKNWRYLLDREGLREPFRMSQAESLHGQFSGWDKRRKDRLVSSFIGVVKLRALCIIGCVISMKDYLNAVSKHDRARVGGPFSICAGTCLLSLSNWIQTSKYYQNELVDVIFEKGTSIANKSWKATCGPLAMRFSGRSTKSTASCLCPKAAPHSWSPLSWSPMRCSNTTCKG